mmetsp:Transcript_44842/g.105634  ORF Transcript_44842/g.105634 Transcript_44842/m.105634 type:complete len:357 (+) Transcript_44842:977-2047(+)
MRHIPADLALVPRRGVVEVLPVQQKHLVVPGARLLVGDMDDADDLERPVLAAVLVREDGRLHGDLIADLPAEPARQPLADEDAVLGLGKGLAMLGRDLHLGVDIEVVGRHRKAEHLVLGLLVGAAKPVRVGGVLDPVDLRDARAQCYRQQLDEAELGAGLQAPRAVGALARLVEADAYRVEQPEQQEGRDDGHQGQQGAALAPEQRGPDEVEVFHGASPQAAAASASVTRVPLSRCRVWLARAAARGSWVTITMVLPCSRLRACSRVSTSSADWRSRSPVGSSQTSSIGSLTMARAMDTRCCWPPDSSVGLCAARSARPTSCSAMAARFLRSLADSLVSSSGSSTFFCADNVGIRL